MLTFKQFVTETNDNEQPKSAEEWAQVRDTHLAAAKRYGQMADKMVDQGHSLDHPLVKKIIGQQRDAEEQASKAHWEHRKATLSGRRV
jgi:hypothetical protein